jgi:hypothetical protein
VGFIKLGQNVLAEVFVGGAIIFVHQIFKK